MSIMQVDVSTEGPPASPPKGGRVGNGKYDLVVAEARKIAEQARRRKRANMPWAVYPPEHEGTRVPEVLAQTFYKLRNRYGEDSPHHERTGEYFEFALSDRVVEYTDRGNLSRGVLWVRQVQPKDGS